MIGIASACGHAGTLIAMLMRHRLDDVHSPQYVALGKNRALLRRASWGRPVRIATCVSLRTRRVCPQHHRPFCRPLLTLRAATCPKKNDRMLCAMTKWPDTTTHAREKGGFQGEESEMVPKRRGPEDSSRTRVHVLLLNTSNKPSHDQRRPITCTSMEAQSQTFSKSTGGPCCAARAREPAPVPSPPPPPSPPPVGDTGAVTAGGVFMPKSASNSSASSTVSGELGGGM